MTPLPELQPNVDEVLEALALETLEHDALRDAHGLPPRGGQRTFTRDDLRRGKEMRPAAMIDHHSNLVFKMDK